MTVTMRPAAFAIPGEITTLTGGYIYERRLLEGLRATGRDVQHLRLGDRFPDPTEADMADAIAQLQALEPDRPLILDGLVFGSIETGALSGIPPPIVAMIHHPLALESGLTEARRTHLFRTERDNLRLAAHVVVPSPHTAATLTRDYGVSSERITIARPGTDRPLGPSAALAPPLILSVGIQHPRKGHDILLSALKRIMDLDWHAVIVGSAHDPDHAEALARLHANLGLGNRASLAGRVSNDRLSMLYRGAALFALATRYEGYGIVFDEALAHGLPIVTCRTGAVPDTVPKDTGLLVPPDDPDAFAGALRTLLEDREAHARMAAASAAAGARLPGWDQVARKMGEVLDRVGRDS